jgi:hypothetical protein
VGAAIAAGTYLVAILMVTTFRYYSFKEIDFARRRPAGVLILVVLGVLIVATHPQWFLFLLFLAYALSGPTRPLWARHARLVGKELGFMPEWDALGFWRDSDHAEWEVEVPKAGTYDVAIEWSVGEQNAGHPFVLESGENKLEGKIESTKRWDVYRIAKVGQIKLDEGTQWVKFKPNGNFKGALMDLREVRLTPAKAQKN